MSLYNDPWWGRFGKIDTIGGCLVLAVQVLILLAGVIALIICAFHGGHL
jgi:hypothetical protein